MKRKILFVVLVVLLTLAFTSASVAADDAVGPLPDLSQSEEITDEPPSSDEIRADATNPAPISPSNYKSAFSQTPKFYFTHNPLATKYKIWVWDNSVSPAVLLYTYRGGTENCGTAYCWLKPTTKLQTYQYSKGGFYKWTVEAKVDGSWQHDYDYEYFYVLSKGFRSTFNVNANKWTVINGNWKIVSPGYYRTPGELGTHVNVRQDEYFTDDYVYEVRYKRVGETSAATRFYFNGYPDPLWESNMWGSGYNFITYNNGAWAFYAYYDEAAHSIANGTTPYYEPSDWNTVKIWIHDKYAYFWVNGVYLGAYPAAELLGGYVGLGMYKGSGDSSPLLVDYARVYYSAVWPEATPMPEGMTPAPAVPQEPSEDTSGWDSNISP